MDNRGPLFTLLAVAVLFFVLLGINVSKRVEPARQAASPPTVVVPTATTTTTAAGSATTTSATAAFPAEASYVGRTTKGDASIAITVKGGKAVAYLCDGRKTEAWLQGTATNGVLSLQGRGGAQLTGEVAGERVSGTVSTGGAEWSFTASSARAPAGLYRANAAVSGVPSKIGWIVQPDGSEVGILNRNGAVEPAPPLGPGVSTVILEQGARLPVEHVTGDSGTG
jgi:hypothetical protein